MFAFISRRSWSFAVLSSPLSAKLSLIEFNLCFSANNSFCASACWLLSAVLSSANSIFLFSILSLISFSLSLANSPCPKP